MEIYNISLTNQLKYSEIKNMPNNSNLHFFLQILSPAGAVMNDLQLINKNDRDNYVSVAREIFRKGKSVSKNLLPKANIGKCLSLSRKIVTRNVSYDEIFTSNLFP